MGLSISIPKIDGIAPLQIPFEAIGEGLDQNIQRDFGDGEQSKGKTVQHTFLLPGTYRVQASTIIKNKKIKAQVMVIVGGQRDKQVALQVKSSSIGKTETGEFTVSTSLIGHADSITRSFSPNDTTNKTPEEIIRKILPPGQYTVTVKANKTKELQAVSMFTIGVGNNKGSILKSNFLNPEINQKTEFQTQTF